MTAAKTLLLVTPYFPPHSGGLERYALEIGKVLQTRGWRVVVATSGQGDEKESIDHLTVYRLKPQFIISNTPFSFRWFSDLRRIMREEKIDIVNVQTPVPGIGDIASLIARVPVIVTYHSGAMNKGSFLFDLIIRAYEYLVLPWMLMRAEHIICASESIRKIFLKRYTKTTTITPAVDHTLFRPGPERGVRALFVAGLTRASSYKGLSRVMRAIARLHKNGIPCELDVVGDGDALEGYMHEAEELGIAHHTVFHGRLHDENLARVYRESSMFILPSAKDSYPLVVLEALASGKPVIASDVGDIPFMVDEGVTGFIVPWQDEERLYARMSLLAGNPHKRAQMGEAARESIARFSWLEQGRRTDEILQRALQKNIVHICGYYLPHIGGIERVVATTSRLLAKNHRVTVISSGGPRLERGNPRIMRLWSFEFAHTPVMPTLMVHLLALPRRSILHLHLAQALIPDIARFAAWVRGFPLIVHYHLEVEPSGFFGPLFTFYKRLTWGPLLRSAAMVIACSEAQRAWIHEHYAVPTARIRVIPNAVGDSFFATEHEPPIKNPRILAIGRLTNQKRMDRSIDACTLAQSKPSLTIVGDGEDRSMLEARARERGIEVHFLGMKNDQEIQALQKNHDMFVIASEREGGTPLVVLEAFAAGIPVIAGDVSGVRDLVDGAGLLVEPTPEALAHAIDALAYNAEQYRFLAHAGIQKARHYTWDKSISLMNDVYNHL